MLRSLEHERNLPLALTRWAGQVVFVDFGVWAFACSFGDERKVRTP